MFFILSGSYVFICNPSCNHNFEILPDILDEPFSTPVGDSVVVSRVYKGCPISLSNRVTLVDLIDLDMLDFDLILGMDLLHALFDRVRSSHV